METLGYKLKKLRIENRLEQSELAEKIGITKKHMSRIERNLNTPRESTLEKYCDYFGVDREYFKPTHEEMKNGTLCTSIIFNSIAPDYSQEERKEAVKEAVDIYKLILKELENEN